MAATGKPLIKLKLLPEEKARLERGARAADYRSVNEFVRRVALETADRLAMNSGGS